MNTPYQPEHIPTLAEILSSPLPEPCHGPMMSQRPPGAVGISKMSEDEKKVFHYLLKANRRTNLFLVNMELRRIADHEENSYKPFDSTSYNIQEEEDEDEKLRVFITEQDALNEIFFNMLYLRLADKIPPNAILSVYENFEIGICPPEDLDD